MGMDGALLLRVTPCSGRPPVSLSSDGPRQPASKIVKSAQPSRIVSPYFEAVSHLWTTSGRVSPGISKVPASKFSHGSPLLMPGKRGKEVTDGSPLTHQIIVLWNPIAAMTEEG